MTEAARSYLFVPGDRPERFDKAVASGADCVVLDLEDAVLPEAKAAARAAVCEWLQRGGKAAVRINGTGTEWHEKDIAVAAVPGVAAIMLPKAEPGTALDAVCGALPFGLPLIAIVETAVGLADARAIAALSCVARLAFGSVDFGNDIGISPEDDQALYHARMSLVIASAAAGIAGPIDGVTLDVNDAERVRADTALARRLGMTGKLCIHPRQVAHVHAAFAPTSVEIVYARQVVEAAEAQGAKGAIRLDNKMIDRPVVERCRRLLSRAASE